MSGETQCLDKGQGTPLEQKEHWEDTYKIGSIEGEGEWKKAIIKYTLHTWPGILTKQLHSELDIHIFILLKD